jgi:hypothetical protein
MFVEKVLLPVMHNRWKNFFCCCCPPFQIVTSIEEGQIRADVAFHFMPDVWHLHGRYPLLWHPILKLCNFFNYRWHKINRSSSGLPDGILLSQKYQLE